MTTADYLNQLEQDRSDLVDNLETQGITGLTGDETFTELVPEVLNISGGGGADLSEYFESTISNGDNNTSGAYKMVKKLPNNITVSGTSLNYAFSRTQIDIPQLDTSNITSMQYMFQSCQNLTTIPMMDTSSVTSMFGMFSGCSSLTSIPLLDTSSVTDMGQMFYGCSRLTSVPQLNTSNVTNAAQMFSGCSSLTSVPQLNTSSVTSMNQTFYGCSNLEDAPALDTSNVTTIYQMFMSCKKLRNLPIYNIPKVTVMQNIFNTSGSFYSPLTNESLNNLLATLLTATSYTGTKTLKFIGLTSGQATVCTGLSNWAACEAAGWTKGY